MKDHERSWKIMKDHDLWENRRKRLASTFKHSTNMYKLSLSHSISDYSCKNQLVDSTWSYKVAFMGVACRERYDFSDGHACFSDRNLCICPKPSEFWCWCGFAPRAPLQSPRLQAEIPTTSNFKCEERTKTVPRFCWGKERVKAEMSSTESLLSKKHKLTHLLYNFVQSASIVSFRLHCRLAAQISSSWSWPSHPNLEVWAALWLHATNGDPNMQQPPLSTTLYLCDECPHISMKFENKRRQLVGNTSKFVAITALKPAGQCR